MFEDRVLTACLSIAVLQFLFSNGYASSSSSSSVISISSPFKVYKGSYYVELPIGENLTLECSRQNRSVWGHKVEGKEEKKESLCGSRRGGISLQMQMTAVSDTGLYECVDVNGTVLESVYAFVFDPNDRSGATFLKEKNINISADGEFIVVPCRMSRFVNDSDVKLFVERHVRLNDISYDSRKGFRIERSSLENLRVTHFRCIYRSHVSQEFVLEAPRLDKPVISATDWVVDFAELSVDCTFRMKDIRNFSYYWKTPLVDENRYKTDVHYVPQGDVIATHLSVQKANRSIDNGDYECVLFNKYNSNAKERSSKIKVQVGVGTELIDIGKSVFFLPNAMFIHNGVMELAQFIETVNDYEYWRNWTKSINGSEEKSVMKEELIAVDFGIENGLRREVILLNNSAIKPHSRYRMEVHMPYIVKVVLFPIEGPPSLRVLQNDFEVNGPLSAFEQISVVCTSIDPASTLLTLSIRRAGDSEWISVNGTQKISSREIIWNTSLSSDLTVKCFDGKTEAVRELVLSPWMKTSGEVVDEGFSRRIFLNCSVLTSKFREVIWFKRWNSDAPLRATKRQLGDFVETFEVEIPKASDEDEGSYICAGTTLDDSPIYQMLHVKLNEGDGAEGQNCPPINETVVFYAWKKDRKGICTAELGRRGSLRRYGEQTFECHHSFHRRKPDHKELHTETLVIIAVIVGLLIGSLVVTLLYARSRRRELKRLRVLHSMLMEHSKTNTAFDRSLPLHSQVEQLPYDVNYEVRLDRLVIQKVLSCGEYGRVYAGRLKHRADRWASMDVAVKGPKDAAKYEHMKALVDELRVMIAIGHHPNVLCLIGAVTQNMRKGEDIFVIMELCAIDLKGFLVKSRGIFVNELGVNDAVESEFYVLPKQDSVQSPSKTDEQKETANNGYLSLSDGVLTTSELVAIAFQVANAMEHLAKKMCVHRDLAARNVLLTRRRIVRIADFGLARQCDHLYHVHSFQLPLPFKSLAPESIRYFHFTEKSDVWSFGILLWEIFTLGEEPYKEIRSVEKLMLFYESGERLPSPVYMPEQLCSLMAECFQADPELRPNFSTCRNVIENVLKDINPQMHTSLLSRLGEELEEMNRYVEWRDGERRKR